MTLEKWLFLGTLLSSGCIAGARETEPPLTALEHEARARRAEQLAAEHETRRDPDLYSIQRCGTMGTPVLQGPISAPQPGFNASGTPTPAPSDPCGSWFDERRDHETEANYQRWVAAQHRAKAARLRSVEARACSALSSDELMARPFESRDDLLAVRALPDYSRTGKASSQRGGATVLVREQPGMTAEKLQRVVQCDAARTLVEGGGETTPWAVPGAQASVVETERGLLVEVTAQDQKTTEEIVRRANLLSQQAR